MLVDRTSNSNQHGSQCITAHKLCQTQATEVAYFTCEAHPRQRSVDCPGRPRDLPRPLLDAIIASRKLFSVNKEDTVLSDRNDGVAEPLPTGDPTSYAVLPPAQPTPGEASSATTDTRRANAQAVLREIVETVLLTLVIFLLIRTVVQNFRVDGMSMEPNFHDGQFLLINKLAYKLGEPQRGDVIVFRYPRDPSRDFIKRVIGLPGETVEVVEGEVYINGQRLDDSAHVLPAAYSSGPVVLGPDELFVMGDNRSNSSDSHSWGPLPLRLVIGKVVLSYWPPSTWGVIKTPTSAYLAPGAGIGQP